MNDFTKIELIALEDAMQQRVIDIPPPNGESPLLIKLQSMIEKYCEHKWDNSCCGCTKGIYCEKCWVNLVNPEDYTEDIM